MEEALRSHLVGASAISSLVGQRVQWAVRESAPCIVLHLIDAPRDRTLKKRGTLVQARVQIDCWATTFLGAKAIGDAVAASMPAIGQVVAGIKFLSCIELDTQRDALGAAPNKLHRTRIDFRISFNPA